LDLLLLWRSLATALRTRPDVIHAHLHEGALIGRFVSAVARRPLVFDYQGSLTDELAAHQYARRDGLLLKAMGVLERWIDRGAARVVASTARATATLGARLGPGRVTTVREGVDTSVFKPISRAGAAAVRRQWGLQESAMLAVFVGMLTRFQGIDLLLEHVARALHAVPRLHILIVGYPSERYRLRVVELGLQDRITFLGRVPFEETPQLTAACDIGLAPKTSATEGNLKVYYYAACGLPVVAFDSHVNREILGESGVYAPLGNGAAFADALGLLAEDPDRQVRLGQAGRARAVKLLSWRHSALELLDVYREVGAVPTAGSKAPPAARTVA
jgi:glycosyltransferase involved in cell wall biosynthesis